MRAAVRMVSVVVAAFVAFGFVACKKNTDPETAGYWLDRLDNKAERIEALKNLGRIGDKIAVAPISRLLEKEGDWQPDAAYALGHLGDASVAPKLEALLTYSSSPPNDARSRRAARFNVALVRSLAMLEARASLPAVKRLLGAGDDRVREAALHALGDLGDVASVDLLIERAREEKNPILRLAAIQALGVLRNAKAVPTLIELLFTERDDLSFYEPASYALLRIGSAATPELLRTLRRENKTVEALRMPGGKSIVEGVIEAKVASLLGAMRAEEAAAPLSEALGAAYARAKKAEAGSTWHAAVVEIAYALGNIGGPRAVAALVPLVQETDLDLRIAACESLTTVGDASVVPALLAAATKGSRRARHVAIVAISRLAGASHLEAFDALGQSGDATVEARTMQEFVASERPRILAASECGAASDCWRKKLVDENSKVRERAAYELGWRAAEIAEADLYTAAVDDDAEVRMAAVLSLNQLDGLDVARLQGIYESWKDTSAYSGVNRELLRLIARAESSRAKL